MTSELGKDIQLFFATFAPDTTRTRCISRIYESATAREIVRGALARCVELSVTSRRIRAQALIARLNAIDADSP